MGSRNASFVVLLVLTFFMPKRNDDMAVTKESYIDHAFELKEHPILSTLFAHVMTMMSLSQRIHKGRWTFSY